MTTVPSATRPSTTFRVLATVPYVLALLVVLYAARYGFPQTDDYCTFGRLVRQHDANPFVETWHLYMNWTGRYTSSFLVAAVGTLTTLLPLSVHAVYAGMLALMIGGVIVGGIAAWLRQRKWRRAARRAQAQARDLRAEVDRLRRRMGEVPADPVAAGYAPRLTIPPPAA